MTARRILTVGLELSSSDCQYVSFHSNTSLLDYNIVLFKPQIDAFLTPYEDFFQGKPNLSEYSSFRLKECCEHWRRELKQAAETGKTVVVFLPTLAQVYVDTGQRSYSGTGRNQKKTRHVTLYDNYQAIPATIAPVAATGTSMKLASLGAEYLAPYWAEFERHSSYKVLLTAEKVPASIVTRTSAKTVGAIYRNKSSSGSLVLLPDIDFYSPQFVREKGGKQTWTTAATQFSNRIVSAVVALDRALCASGEVTPEPTWAADSAFALAGC